METGCNTPDFEDKKSWKMVLEAAIHYQDKAQVKAGSVIEVLLAGGELKLPSESNEKSKIGVVAKYQSLKDKNLTGKTISYFNDKPVFKVWGLSGDLRPSVAIRLHKKWVMHDLGGEILRMVYVNNPKDKIVSHIYFEFYNPDKRPYAYIFLENPKNPLANIAK